MRAAALALLAASLLALPALPALAVPLAAEPAPAHPWAARLRLSLDPAVGLVAVEPLVSAPEGEPGSTCQLFSPFEFDCVGNEVFVDPALGPWGMDVLIDLESASNSWVHIVEQVNNTPVFAYSIRTNVTWWFIPEMLDDTGINMFEVRPWGFPRFDVTARVRLDVSHLPAAGEFNVGGWHAWLGPLS